MNPFKKIKDCCNSIFGMIVLAIMAIYVLCKKDEE